MKWACDKLEYVQALMRHRNPNGDLAIVVERALDVLIERLEKQKLGKTSRPATAKPPASEAPTSEAPTQEPRAKGATPPAPGYISRASRREVFARDGFVCSFVSEDGERCTSRAYLELDHAHPRALGGTGEPANLRVRYRSHNRYAAEQVFGREHVERHMHLRQRRSRSTIESPPAGPLRPPGTAVSAISAVSATEQPPPAREQLYSALVEMGFRVGETNRALSKIDPLSFTRPLAVLLREALAILT